MEVGGSDYGTGTDTHGGSARTKGVYETVPISAEGGQEMQGEESGGGIETLVEIDQMREVWSKIQRWNQEAKCR